MTALAHAQTVNVARPYIADHYSAALTIDFEHKRIQGTETIRVRSSGEQLRELEFDADEIVVKSVTVGRQPQRFSQLVDTGTSRGHVRIQLNRPLKRHGRIDIELTFEGSPAKGLLFIEGQAYTVYNTSHWLVVNHEPRDLATFDLSLDVPGDMVVVANGDNIANTRAGNRLLSKWEEKRAIPDFVLGFAVGRYAQESAMVGQTTLRYFSARHNGAQMGQVFHSTAAALRFFSEKAGVAYPSRSYTQVLAGGSPEQELGDFTLLPGKYGDQLLSQPDDEWLMAHELAHQWWGIGVACRTWSDFWLNEGIASFMADVFLGEQYGAARYEDEIEMARNVYNGLKDSGKDRPLHFTDWKSEKDVGGRLPYSKGAWVLHLLKQQLGEETFWRGFSSYTRRNWGRTVTTGDFQLSMEQAAGMSLRSFFDQWVYR